MSDSSSDAAQTWKRAFGEASPIGYMLRNEIADRWLRIHSLPQSKRYPETASERKEVLRRHNEVATTLLGQDEPCLIIVARHYDSPEYYAENHTAIGMDLRLQPIPPAEQVDDDWWLHFAAAPATWSTGKFDTTIDAIADDTEANILFANCARGSVYAPYDGGADLILRDKNSVDLARKRWSTWLSPLASGL